MRVLVLVYRLVEIYHIVKGENFCRLVTQIFVF